MLTISFYKLMKTTVQQRTPRSGDMFQQHLPERFGRHLIDVKLQFWLLNINAFTLVSPRFGSSNDKGIGLTW